ncbi:hypothetical protein [Jeotgalicoccus sp. ATCC 8456]|uniref:accessory Sec system protein Asp2 n=1 Tax=Jeotgalicoccus sp. ATCC 8456 TaxID=946435 RepID=UPI0018E60D1E|nr:hypothetical protein [Jeotgalicoccus sp. ATCC 8456]QQD85657.1 hypothetical protein JEM45_03265 [Jeotgalicoccus sp. ATCC 8456]
MVKIKFNPTSEFNIQEESRLVILDKESAEFVLTQIIKKDDIFTFDSKMLKAHWNYRYKYQVRRKDRDTGLMRWSDNTEYKRLYPERQSQSGLKYLLYKKPKSKKLLVMFQAINHNPTYNYVGLLRDSNVHQLYIKDDYGLNVPTKTSYYLNYNTNFDVVTSVQKIISKVLSEVNLEMKDVIFAGSSKGGFAALYYAYKLGSGHVIAGGPQVLLGEYLSKGHEESSVGKSIFKSMFGEINEQNIEKSNSILLDVVENSEFKNIDVNIHVGYWEPHFTDHVQPFMDIAKNNEINNITLHLDDYDTHSGLATYFPPFLKQTVESIGNF